MTGRRSALIAICAAVAGCRVTTGPGASLLLAVTPAQASVAAGHAVTIEVLATSTGDAPVTFFAPHCVATVDVMASDGTRVEHPHGVVCAAVLMGPVTLQPGESRKFLTAWLTRTAPQQLPVAPGTYVLRAANFRVRAATVEHLPASVTVTN